MARNISDDEAPTTSKGKTTTPSNSFSKVVAGDSHLFKSDTTKFSNRSRVNFCRPLSATSDSRSGGTPDSESQNRMFILGMGFVGGLFAQRLKEADWVVSGTCRSDSKKKEWEKRGIDLQLFTADSPEWSLLETVKDYTHLLISVPPLADIGDPMLWNVARVRDKLSSGNLRWLCYLSSTSVYGDYGGVWVNEDHPQNPKTQSAKLRLAAAEEGWLSVGRYLGVSTQVLRLGGIYGPGRRLFTASGRRLFRRLPMKGFKN